MPSHSVTFEGRSFRPAGVLAVGGECRLGQTIGLLFYHELAMFIQ
jgi:hypothetical protein